MPDPLVPINKEDTSETLPAIVEPLMALHLLITQDTEQNRHWNDRIEAIRQASAVEAAPDPPSKRLLASRAAWDEMRTTGQLGATLSIGLGAAWMAWLVPLYAIGHGFGWLAALTYLLPVPLATRVARTLWERASLAGMRDLGQRPTLRQRLATLARGTIRSFGAGFGFGFTLTFLQGLISAFMTPEPTLIAELVADAAFATVAGMVSGTLSTIMAPLVSRAAPELPASTRPPKALPTGDL